MGHWENSALSGRFPHAIFKIWYDQSAMAIHTTLQVIKKWLRDELCCSVGGKQDHLLSGQWRYHERTSGKFRHNRDCFKVTAVFVSFLKVQFGNVQHLDAFNSLPSCAPPHPREKGRTARWVVDFLLPFSRFGMISLLWQYIQPCKWSKSGCAMNYVVLSVGSKIICYQASEGIMKEPVENSDTKLCNSYTTLKCIHIYDSKAITIICYMFSYLNIKAICDKYGIFAYLL